MEGQLPKGNEIPMLLDEIVELSYSSSSNSNKLNDK